MIVRRASMLDMEALIRMGTQFLAYAPQGKHFAINESEMVASWTRLLSSPQVVVFVGDRDGTACAMLVGVVGSMWFAPSVLMASELAWWVEPEVRGSPIAIRLIRAYEQWATESGASFIAMASLSLDSGPDVGRLLKKLGYTQAETTHIKEQ